MPNLKFELVNRGPANPYSSFGLYLIDQWRQIGVTVQNTVVDTAGWVQRRNSGNYQVIVDATADPSDDPNMTLVRYTSSDKQPANPTGFIDREIDTLFDAQSGVIRSRQACPPSRSDSSRRSSSRPSPTPVSASSEWCRWRPR